MDKEVKNLMMLFGLVSAIFLVFALILFLLLKRTSYEKRVIAGQYEKVISDKAKVDGELKAMEAAKVETEAKLKKSEENLRALSSQMDAEKTKNNALAESAKQRESEVSALKEEVKKYEKTSVSTAAKLKTAQASLAEKEKQLAGLLEYKESSDTKLRELSSELDEANREKNGATSLGTLTVR